MIAAPQDQHDNPPSFRFFLNEKVLQEVVSKDPIIRIVVDLNKNDVGLYRHYYNIVNNKTDTFPWIKMGNPKYEPLPCSNKWSEQLQNPFWSEKKARLKARSKKKKKKSRVEVPYALARRVLIKKLKLLYEISDLSLYIFILETFLLEPSSYVILHLILWGDDKVCHRSLMFVTYLKSICSSVVVRHLLTDLICSLI